MRLRELRNKMFMNQSDVAKLIGVSRSTIAMWETGRHEPDNETLIRLAEYFDVTTDYLLGKEPKNEPTPVVGAGIKESAEDITPLEARLAQQVKAMSPEEQQRVLAFAQGILSSRRE